MSASRQPVLFLSHGSPMQAIQSGGASAAWHDAAEVIGKPNAIVMVSAHWDTNIPMVTGSDALETIHDFGGFPAQLYRLQYPAKGQPELARRVQALVSDAGMCTGIEAQRGLDHGAWVPLLHMYPQADIPVLQVSLQSERGARHHFAMGQALSPLRDEGVLIVASGHMTHNLRDFFTHAQAQGVASYAQDFRNWVDERVRSGRVDELLDWDQKAPSALRAHPTPEHFLPLFVALGAAGERYATHTIYSGFDGGVLAMDAYSFQ